MTSKEVGKIDDIPCDAKKIEWKIPNFSSIIQVKNLTEYVSPKFNFNDIYWRLGLMSGMYFTPNSIQHYLKSDGKQNYSVEYYYGFKKYDGNVQLLANGILKKNECSSNRMYEAKKIFHEQKSELVPTDLLTISCTLMVINEARHSTQRIVWDQTKPMKLIKLDKLSENFKSIFNNKESCDVTLKVKDKDYKAHKLVLIARSSVFAANFKHDTIEKQTGTIIIPDCDPDSFQEFLEYIYCGKLERISASSAMNLYYTSDKYDVGELKNFCIEYLMQNLTVENICEVAVFSYNYDQTELYSAVQDFFNKNVCDISETAQWESLLRNDYHLANKLLKGMLKVNVKK